MAQVQDMQQMAAPSRAQSFKKLTNFLGAAVSVGLLVGIGIWGYKLLVRDVSGVPVVRAAEGPMRVQPEEPGGVQALNQGLAVNDVAADGGATAPADRLALAPNPLELSLEDVPITVPEEAGQSTPMAEVQEPVSEPLEEETVQLASVDALVARIVEDVKPLDDLPGIEAAEAETPPNTRKVEGGLGKSLRPHVRPASMVTNARVETVAAFSSEVDPAKIPTGTRLAQLGAFESAEIARSEWKRLSGKFGEYLEGKDRVVQKAKSGGRVFYRLRAMGFTDLNDARRFCSALLAENAECIPVVTR